MATATTDESVDLANEDGSKQKTENNEQVKGETDTLGIETELKIQFHAAEINGLWKTNVDNIISVCLKLKAIKEELTKDKKVKPWSVFKKELVFGGRTIDRLVEIGGWEALVNKEGYRNFELIEQLPMSWGTIYEIYKWQTSDKKQDKDSWVKNKSQINRDSTRAEIASLRRGDAKKEKEISLITLKIKETDAKSLYKDASEKWIAKKLEELKDVIFRDLKSTKAEYKISIDVDSIDKKITSVGDLKEKNQKNKYLHKSKVEHSLQLILRKVISDEEEAKVKKDENYKELDPDAIESDYFQDKSMDALVQHLKNKGKTNIDFYNDVFMGMWDKDYFIKTYSLEEVEEEVEEEAKKEEKATEATEATKPAQNKEKSKAGKK
jgi:hypothetical protein